MLCDMDITGYGYCIMILALIGLATVGHLYVWGELKRFHTALLTNVLTPAVSRILRRHMKRSCVECSFHAELRSSVRITRG